ncbi:MAG: diaminohydroxyphosphoribosylaminopyrimidine deaminase [Polaribacter sp.]
MPVLFAFLSKKLTILFHLLPITTSKRSKDIFNMEKKLYLQRCFDLAQQGVADAPPNPMVGAVLVHQDEIIGEGFHAKFGEGHAEVAALKSVTNANKEKIKKSTLYVSLEPCCIVGNTPACSDLIIRQNIKNIVYSVSDPTPAVNGSSKKILKSAGCTVESDLLPNIGNNIIKTRAVWVNKQRPYIILKYAESADGFIGKRDKQVWLSNNISKIVSHKWRSEVSAILVGTNTVKTDDPALTNRLYSGKSPTRIFIDKQLKLTTKLQVFNQEENTWVFTEQKAVESKPNLQYIPVEKGKDFITAICQKMHANNKGVLLVEGGQKLLQSFIDADCWDEARIFKTPVVLGTGIAAPRFSGRMIKQIRLKDNVLQQWLREEWR